MLVTSTSYSSLRREGRASTTSADCAVCSKMKNGPGPHLGAAFPLYFRPAIPLSPSVEEWSDLNYGAFHKTKDPFYFSKKRHFVFQNRVLIRRKRDIVCFSLAFAGQSIRQTSRRFVTVGIPPDRKVKPPAPFRRRRFQSARRQFFQIPRPGVARNGRTSHLIPEGVPVF